MKTSRERTSTWRKLNWCWEGWRTGEGFAAIARRHSLIYRVEQIFLIHRRTNQVLLHVAEDSSLPQAPAKVATALRDIQDMARDFFFVEEHSELKELRRGEDQVWFALHSRAYLAAIIRGEAPSGLRLALQETMARIHAKHLAALKTVSADSTAFESARPDLSSLVRSEYRSIPECPRLPSVWPVAARLHLRRVWPVAICFVALVGLLFSLQSFRKSRADGSRTRSLVSGTQAADDKKTDLPPASQPSVNSGHVRAYEIMSESKKALAQFEASFPLPPAVKATVANGTLVLAGTAPYEWIRAVQEGAPKIPGISGIKGDDLVVEFTPELVLQRFRQQFGIPETVDASFRNGRLILTGEATHSWLDRVRREARYVPGVQLVDDRRVVDIDQRTFHEAKTEIEEAAVLFVLNRDSLPEEAATTLGQTAAAAQRCLLAASNMQVNVSLEVRAYGDAIATEAENVELSRRRAETVKNFLVASGVESKNVDSLGMGTPPPPGPGERTGAGGFDRRVFLRVVIQP